MRITQMKYTLSGIALAAVLVACDACVPRSIDVPNTLSQPAVAKLLIADDTGEEVSHCTLWKVDEDLAVTAGHCCSDEFTYTVTGAAARPGEEARILIDLKPDDDDGIWTHDVCVMRAHLKGPTISLADADPPIGARIWTLGYPRGQFMISDGIWSGRVDTGEGICSGVGVGGASGSPILDADSRAVGVLVAGWRNGDNMTLVANLEKLRSAVRKARAIKVVSEDVLED